MLLSLHACLHSGVPGGPWAASADTGMADIVNFTISLRWGRGEVARKDRVDQSGVELSKNSGERIALSRRATGMGADDWRLETAGLERARRAAGRKEGDWRLETAKVERNAGSCDITI